MCFLKRALIFLLLLLSASAALAQTVEPADEEQIVRLVNEERGKAGLAPLAVSPQLTEIARQHSRRMAKDKTLAHQLAGEPDPRQRTITSGIRFDMSGENVAFAGDAPSAHRSLMHSPPHRENILRPEFTAIGVGVVRVGESIYVTQDFARQVADLTLPQAESAVVRSFAELRRSAKYAPLKLVSQKTLRGLACNMAQEDRLETDLARDIPNVRSVLVWTASDPAKLPDSMQKWRTLEASGWSVGGCFASSPKYPVPVWWMVAVAYF